MNKRARICLYIFLVCAFAALGIVGYFILGNNNENVMVAPKYFTFIEVPGADSYMLTASKQNDTKNTISANCKIYKQKTENENEYIFINIVSDEDGKILVKQKYNQIITNVNDKLNTVDCKIFNYTLTTYDEEGKENKVYSYPDKEIKSVSEKTIYCLIAEYFGEFFNEDGEYNINFVAVDADGQAIKNTENTYKFNYVACYENEFNKREDFYMNGIWNDYVITSYNDLELFVWHALLYRENDVTFYVKNNSITRKNINDLVIRAINNYPEYNGIYENNLNLYAKMEGTIGTLVNFKYYLDDDFTKTYSYLREKYGAYADEAESAKQEKEKKFSAEYITVQDNLETSGANRVLDIDLKDNDKDEVEVFNTEQLQMVMQYGAKPIIKDDTSVVAIVYKNARNILLEINNSNKLTPFEKALNIYRYICNNITYDHVVGKYIKMLDKAYVSIFGNINCFYMEGALLDLDNQYAVCDGLAKTFCLLTNMEGINCVKVNGYVEDPKNLHAWNKINLVDTKYDLNGWYPVDTTWGVEDNNNLEITTHTYFLRLGNEARGVTFQANTDNAELLQIDYYTLLKYTNDNDYNISSDEELSHLIKYAKNKAEINNSAVIEFKLDATNSIIPSFNYTYFDDIRNRYSYPYTKFTKNIFRANLEESNYNAYFAWLGDIDLLELDNYCYDIGVIGNVVIMNITKKQNNFETNSLANLIDINYYNIEQLVA